MKTTFQLNYSINNNPPGTCILYLHPWQRAYLDDCGLEDLRATKHFKIVDDKKSMGSKNVYIKKNEDCNSKYENLQN